MKTYGGVERSPAAASGTRGSNCNACVWLLPLLGAQCWPLALVVAPYSLSLYFLYLTIGNVNRCVEESKRSAQFLRKVIGKIDWTVGQCGA